MSPKNPIRRSSRLSAKKIIIRKIQPKRQVVKPPVIVYSDSEDDNDDVIYIEPEAPPLIDLTKTPDRIPSNYINEENTGSPVVILKRIYKESLRKDHNQSQNNYCKTTPKKPPRSTRKSPLKEPPRTPEAKSNDHKIEDIAVTPPKQRKIGNDENVPRTPTTPSVLLEKLSLSESQEKNRKKLFPEDLYQSAKKALHVTYPTNMPGREKELTHLKDFIFTHLKNKSSGALYISGPPGTGKTASLNMLWQQEKINASRVYVNCTALKSPGSIFSRIAEDLGLKINSKNEKYCANSIEKYLKKPHKTILLILDEIDQLETKNESVLYTIFEWPSIINSQLILIGIANALDLTDRTLPRLQARCELKPQLMHFAPYTKQQIVEILTSRLKDAGVLDIFTPVALQMLAGKVAAISGDVRRALDIGRRVVDLVDRRRSNGKILRSLDNLAEELEADMVEEKNESVNLQQVVNVLNKVYGTTQNLNDDVDDCLPIQQKIVVCSLLLILKKAKNKDVTVGRLHEVYRKVCGKRNIQIVDQGEFVGLCSLIETRGIVKIIKKKDPRMDKICLMWDEEEVVAALKDKQLMSTILQDDSCLGNL